MPVSFPPPPAGVVRVWLASLDAPPLPVAQLTATLAPDERARAAHFAFADERARYHAGRGLLRVVLAAATDAAPASLRFALGANGRQRLAEDAGEAHGRASVAFNLSHAGDRVAIALAIGDAALALGVDIERTRAVPELARVAARVFDETERAGLDAEPDDAARLDRFHRLWTRKEACMKATGAGLALAPRRFRVDPHAPVQHVALPPHDYAPQGITLAMHALPDVGGCVGAVAIAVPSSGAGWTLDVVRLPQGS